MLLILPVGCARPAPQPATPAVSVAEIDAKGLGDVVRQCRGRVVLVDFWATWCPTCLELFPHTVELQRRFADRGLTVVSLSMDDPDQLAAVQKFLGRKGGDLQNFIDRGGGASQSFADYKIDNGALPHLKLYDRQGKLRKTFSSGEHQIDARQIDNTVEELLGEGGGPGS
jgi:thiol-disulfide isomerase/thioredoxin